MRKWYHITDEVIRRKIIMSDQIRISPERMLERSREYQAEADNI